MNCKYYYPITKTQIKVITIDENYQPLEIEPEEVLIGEYCYYFKDYNLDCCKCSLNKKEKENEKM